ncbi:fiber [Bovine adenovirus 6]|uniref:Fiber n=1 Tax=Bovine adenovirus 6 TaxID=111167 RepID=K9MNV0_9ADEN|nr:fiber [Bovine adenovirus 6]AFV70650.1 fiber [Bovine adenovirus 6]
MKRARWDPVYPFTEERLIPLPPFIRAGSGLESEGLILSLKFTDPITVNPAGFLTVKTGEGIQINEVGQLTSSAIVEAEAPLEKLPGSIKLNMEDVFTVDSNGKLSIILNSPFEKTAEGIKLKLANTFITNENGNLALTAPQSPLTLTPEGQLSLLRGNTLITDENGKLTLTAPESPLTFTPEGKLSLLRGNTLITDETGKLALTAPESPLTLTQEGKLSLLLGQPFTTADNVLSLKTQRPLSLSTGYLTLNLADPFIELNGKLDMQSDNTIQVENAKLGVKAVKPLENTDQGLKINLGNPFSTYNNQLAIKTAYPLTVNAAGELTTSTKQGSQVVGFMNSFIALGWQIIPSAARFIYILTCSQFLPDSEVSLIKFQADTGLRGVFALDTSFYATATQQLVDRTIKTYGVSIYKDDQDFVLIEFSSALVPNIPVSAWTASMTRL